MTSSETKDLMNLIESLEHPSVSGTVYEEKDGKLTRREVNTVEEVNRLLDSPDYRAGWYNAAKRTKETVTWLVAQSRNKRSRSHRVTSKR